MVVVVGFFPLPPVMLLHLMLARGQFGRCLLSTRIRLHYSRQQTNSFHVCKAMSHSLHPWCAQIDAAYRSLNIIGSESLRSFCVPVNSVAHGRIRFTNPPTPIRWIQSAGSNPPNPICEFVSILSAINCNIEWSWHWISRCPTRPLIIR